MLVWLTPIISELDDNCWRRWWRQQQQQMMITAMVDFVDGSCIRRNEAAIYYLLKRSRMAFVVLWGTVFTCKHKRIMIIVYGVSSTEWWRLWRFPISWCQTWWFILLSVCVPKYRLSVLLRVYARFACTVFWFIYFLCLRRHWAFF